MPNEFTVIGENITEDAHLLVVGADGKYYRYAPEREDFTQVEPDERWLMYDTGDGRLPESSAAEGGSP